MLEAPGTFLKRFSDKVQRIGFPVANSSEANDQARVLARYQRCVVPDLPKLCSEGFRTHMVQLPMPTYCVIDVVRAAHEPVSQPLVLHVGSHAVIRRRADDPVEGPPPGDCVKPARAAAIV